MKFDFDTPVDRTGTDCLKWDYLEEFFGRSDLESLWVADMDFRVPDAILQPILQRAKHGVFGYTARPDSFYSAVTHWFRTRYGWETKREWTVATPGVVPALNFAIQTFTDPGDGIVIQPPVYFPFEESVRLNGREALNNRLLLEGGSYSIDFADLDEKAARSKMLILCSPHNPVARVWSREELEEVGRICERHGLILFSDEIHADIVFSPNSHVPAATMSDYLLNNSISAYAVSKSFNLAGLQLSVNVIPNETVRNRFQNCLEKLHMNMSNIFGIVGTQSAYANGGEWLDQLLDYLWKNYEAADGFLKENIPAVSVLKPEGTFLLWMDCRALNLSDDELASLFVNKAKLALSPGALFGPGGSGFMRLNIACPRRGLLKALKNLKLALEDDSPIPKCSGCGGNPGGT